MHHNPVILRRLLWQQGAIVGSDIQNIQKAAQLRILSLIFVDGKGWRCWVTSSVTLGDFLLFTIRLINISSLIKRQDQCDRICSPWIVFWKLERIHTDHFVHVNVWTFTFSTESLSTFLYTHVLNLFVYLCFCSDGKQTSSDLKSLSCTFPTFSLWSNTSREPLARCTSSLCSQYQLSQSVIRSSSKTHFLAERPDLPLKDKRDVKRHVQLGVDHNCDPQRCGPVIENTLADTQPLRWFTVSWWFSLLWDLGVRDNGSLCCHSLRWMRHERNWKGAKPGV